MRGRIWNLIPASDSPGPITPKRDLQSWYFNHFTYFGDFRSHRFSDDKTGSGHFQDIVPNIFIRKSTIPRRIRGLSTIFGVLPVSNEFGLTRWLTFFYFFFGQFLRNFITCTIMTSLTINLDQFTSNHDWNSKILQNLVFRTLWLTAWLKNFKKLTQDVLCHALFNARNKNSKKSH